MSKVQVDTIVDKDDISAPSLTKGAIVTGVCTATSFDGAISEWVLGADGTSHYTFTGSGLTGAENDPTLYLKRGQKYRFKNSSGGHPFRIQSTANGSAGTAYNDGVTNNDAGDGTTLEWDVQFDAPSVLYYQCTAHGSMGGKIYIGNSGNSSTLVDLNVSGVTTTGIATVTTSVVVGSAVTANADGVITAGVGTFGSIVSGAISGSTGTFTGDIDIADKIVHTGDTDTAIRFSAADTVTVETGGTNRITINNNASVNTLDVAGGARADFFVGRSNQSVPTADASIYRAADNTLALATSSTERLRIGSSGEIGIAGANYGTSGQVLTSGGSGAAISWTTPAGGGWVPIANNSVSSSDSTSVLCDFSSCFDSTYDHYRVEFMCHVGDITSTGTVDNLLFRQYDSGSLRTGSDYDYVLNYSGNGSSTRYNSTNGNGPYAFMSGNQDSQAWQGHIDIWNTHETTIQATFNWWMNGYYIYQPDGPTNNNRLGVNGVCAAANGTTPVAVTGFKIYTNGGYNLQNGNVVVYGLKTS